MKGNGHSVRCPFGDETAHLKYPLRVSSGAAEANIIAMAAHTGKLLYATGFQVPDLSKHKTGRRHPVNRSHDSSRHYR